MHIVKELFLHHNLGNFNFPSSKVRTPKCTKASEWKNRHRISELATEAASNRLITDLASNGEGGPILGKLCTQKHLETLHPQGSCLSSVSNGSHRPQTSLLLIGRCLCQPGEKFQYFTESIVQQETFFFFLVPA